MICQDDTEKGFPYPTHKASSRLPGNSTPAKSAMTATEAFGMSPNHILCKFNEKKKDDTEHGGGATPVLKEFLYTGKPYNVVKSVSGLIT